MGSLRTALLAAEASGQESFRLRLRQREKTTPLLLDWSQGQSSTDGSTGWPSWARRAKPCARAQQGKAGTDISHSPLLIDDEFLGRRKDRLLAFLGTLCILIFLSVLPWEKCKAMPFDFYFLGKAPHPPKTPLLLYQLLFYYFDILGFELRASRLLGRCPTTWATLPAIFLCWVCSK
jgi:hypothetical protein